MLYHFHFIEQHSFFAFTSVFFQQYTTKPWEFFIYCRDFFVQFYVFPYLGAALVTALLVLVFIFIKFMTRIFSSNVLYSTFFALFSSALLTSLIFWSSFSKFDSFALKNNYEKVSYLAEQEDWETIWKLCKSYFLNPNNETNGFYPLALSEYAKIAAIMTKQLGEEYTELISLPKFNTLFPSHSETRRSPFVDRFAECDFYYNLGFFVFSKHCALNLTGLLGLQNRLICRIALCNILIDDTLGNVKYINLLSKTPFRKHFLENRERDTLYLKNKRKLRAEKEFTEPASPDAAVLVLSDVAPQNPYALEYACMYHLLYLKNENYLIEHLHRFRNLEYTHLPRFFEEALIVSTNYGIDPSITTEDLKTMDFDGFLIRLETINRAEKFFQAFGNTKQAFLNFRAIENEFKNTYFFHKLMRQ
jgi:hypothetical protein